MAIKTGYTTVNLHRRAKDGEPGTSPILCDLTNEMDSVACDSDGNPVTTGNANVKSTTVVLYKGSTLDTSTYKLKVGSAAQSSADVTTATTCATGITYKRTGNALSFTVGNTAADSTAITITAESATDASVKGTCTFTIAKVKPGSNGNDAEVYNINVDADAIARSEAGSNTPSSLTVYINKTKGATTTQITPSSSTFLYYAKDGAATKTKLTSASLSVSDVTSKVELFLYDKAHDATGAVLLDKETICVVKDGKKGDGGTSPILFDLDNEMDSVACDKDGKASSATTITTHGRLYKGTTLITDATQPAADSLKIGGVTPTVTYTGGVLTVQWTFAKGTALSEKSTASVKLTYGGVDYTQTFTLNGVRAGQPGSNGNDAEVYNINVDADAIARSEAGSNTPSSLTVYINKTKGATTEQITPSSSTFLYYAKDGAATKTKLTSASLSVSDVTSKVELFLYDKALDATGAVLLDKEAICIVKDGNKGDQGDKGDKGDKGDQGDQGDKGDKGDQGDNGAPGSDATQPNLFGYACPITCSSLAVAHTASGLAAWIVKAAGTTKLYDVTISNISVPASRILSVHMSLFSAAAATIGLRLVNSDGTYSSTAQMPAAANTELDGFTFGGLQSSKAVTAIQFRISLAAATAMNGMFRISNLKIEDSTETNDHQKTSYNGLAVQQLSVRPNIIPDTQFLKRSKWATFDGSVLSKEYLGLNVFKASVTVPKSASSSDLSYSDPLKMDLSGMLKANTFYTLSYWVKASSGTNTRIDSYIYPSMSAATLICVEDGNPASGKTDNILQTSGGLTQWLRKTITFRTPSSLPSSYSLLFRILNLSTSASISRDLYIAQPKLEEGDYATDYCQSEEDKHGTRGAFSILKWSEIAHGYHFYDAKAVGDMEIADVVIDDVTLGSDNKPLNLKYICKKEHIYDSEEYSKPDTSGIAATYWEYMESYGNIATDLLLSDQIYARVLQAVNARIDNLILNRAQATDADGNVTVSIDGTTGELEATGKITAKMFLSAVKSVSEKTSADETLVIDPDTDGVSLYNIAKINDKTLTIQLPCLSKYEGIKLTFNRNGYGKVRFVQDNKQNIYSPSVVNGYIKASWTFGPELYMPANSNVTLQYLGNWTVINGWLSTNSTL